MATYNFTTLKKKYDNFEHPVVVLTINGTDFAKNRYGFIVSDVEVELTSGFEASIATFTLYNTFDIDNSCFRIKDAEKYILLGSSVELAMGYEKNVQTVFCGFISRVNFVYAEGEAPGIRITAMDVKGVMMANNYSKQLTSTSFGDAVKEILNKSAYTSMASSNIIKRVVVSDTPDKKPLSAAVSQASDRTVEMVAESDYEFVVKAAKRYNFEFFTECGNVYFRKAKANAETVMEGVARKWAQHGYECPHVIYWNVNARNDNIPALGVGRISFVSGFSPSIFSTIMSGKDGIDLMLDKLNSQRYAPIE